MPSEVVFAKADNELPTVSKEKNIEELKQELAQAQAQIDKKSQKAATEKKQSKGPVSTASKKISKK